MVRALSVPAPLFSSWSCPYRDVTGSPCPFPRRDVGWAGLQFCALLILPSGQLAFAIRELLIRPSALTAFSGAALPFPEFAVGGLRPARTGRAPPGFRPPLSAAALPPRAPGPACPAARPPSRPSPPAPGFLAWPAFPSLPWPPWPASCALARGRWRLSAASLFPSRLLALLALRRCLNPAAGRMPSGKRCHVHCNLGTLAA